MVHHQCEATLCLSGVLVFLLLLGTVIHEATAVVCGEDFSDSTNTFKTPNYPSDYDNNVECVWTIIVPVGYTIEISFEATFDIEEYGNCAYDYLEVRDVQSDGSTTTKKLCGTTAPTNYKSAGRKLQLKFVSDFGSPHKGFQATYQQKDIDECALSKGGCQQNCANSQGSFTCSCDSGYTLSGQFACKDTDECQDNNGGCAEKCVNKERGFDCACNNPSRFRLESDGSPCVDIDECASRNGGCQQNCANSPGSFSCSCNSGFTQNSQFTCRDVDECANGASCPGQTKCKNTEGSFVCVCDNGYTNNNDQCDDIDECGSNTDDCQDNCQNSVGSFTCSCNSGYVLDSDGKACKDKDECAAADKGGCEQVCDNNPGSFACKCTSGYLLNADVTTCADIDECATSNGGCEHNCNNTVGSFECSCLPGYSLNVTDNASCSDIDECATSNGGCEHNCTNIDGSFNCSCLPGYSLNVTDNASCLDVDECVDDTDGCGQNCTNTVGSFFCTCFPGYLLDIADNSSCLDINECEENNGGCQHTCTNNVGSFVCSCFPGYVVDKTNSSACQRCGGDFLTSAGEFESPLYPAPYVNKFDCTWTFIVPTGYIVQLSFSSTFDIEPYANCAYDYLEIRDVNKFGVTNATKLCGTSVPQPVISSGRKLLAYFVSDYGVPHKGFQAQFQQIDQDECAEDLDNCQQVCNNTDGSFFCSCRIGYTLNADKIACTDIDECATNKGGCSVNCENTPGSRSCSCNSGYKISSDGISCEDVNECEGSNGCDQICTNSVGSFVCSCRDGYTLNTVDRSSCLDINECDADNAGCDHICTNTPGSFRCSCRDGYTLMSTDNSTCTDPSEAWLLIGLSTGIPVGVILVGVVSAVIIVKLKNAKKPDAGDNDRAAQQNHEPEQKRNYFKPDVYQPSPDMRPTFYSGQNGNVIYR